MKIIKICIATLILVLLCSCSNTEEYATGSGTASRSDVSYNNGLDVGGNPTVSGDWKPAEGTVVSEDISNLDDYVMSMLG